MQGRGIPALVSITAGTSFPKARSSVSSTRYSPRRGQCSRRSDPAPRCPASEVLLFFRCRPSPPRHACHHETGCYELSALAGCLAGQQRKCWPTGHGSTAALIWSRDRKHPRSGDPGRRLVDGGKGWTHVRVRRRMDANHEQSPCWKGPAAARVPPRGPAADCPRPADRTSFGDRHREGKLEGSASRAAAGRVRPIPAGKGGSGDQSGIRGVWYSGAGQGGAKE